MARIFADIIEACCASCPYKCSAKTLQAAKDALAEHAWYAHARKVA